MGIRARRARRPGHDTLHSSPTLVLPLKAPMRIRGVLVVAMPQGEVPGVEPRRLLQTCASLLAISLERIHYIDVAQKSTVQIESERLRNSLLSAISHDLRTPLASLVGLAESLAMVQPPLPAHQQELTGAIQQSAQRMSALVNNLLDMARLEAGAVQLNKAWQPLEEVVGSALAASAPAIAAHRVEVTLPDDLPLLQIDAVLMERVLVNLLENAAKYTPADTTIHISAQPQSDAVALTLTDEGPGLPKGREELLFEKFERGARESATPGVGLGLAICRAIVQAHGGSIQGRYHPQRPGPTCRAHASRCCCHAAHRPPTWAMIPIPTATFDGTCPACHAMTDLPTHILIVEDEADIRRFVRLTLESEGHTVHEAATLQRGLIEAGTRRPDLVVLDLGLPDGDGVDLIRDLRTWSAMPIIVLSARSAEASKIAALDAGADDYLVKPFGSGELMARVRAQLRRSQRASSARGAYPSSSSATSP